MSLTLKLDVCKSTAEISRYMSQPVKERTDASREGKTQTDLLTCEC